MAITKIKSKNSKHFNEWRVRAQPRDPAGNTVSLPIAYCKGTKNDAKKLYQQMMVDFERESTYYTDKKLKLVDSYSSYLQSEYRAGRWEKRTYLDHEYTLRVLKQYLPNTKLEKINENVMRLFIRKFAKDHNLTVGYDTVLSKRIQHLRTFFMQLTGSIFKHNPVPKHALDDWFRKGEMTPKKEIFTLNNEQVKLLKGKVIDRIKNDSPDKIVSLVGILICLTIGCRPSEVQALSWDDLIIEHTNNGNKFHIFNLHDSYNELESKFNGHLKSRMTGETRKSFALSDDVLEALQIFHQKQTDYLKNNGLKNKDNRILLSLQDFRRTDNGKVISQKSMNEALKRLCRKLEIKNEDGVISLYTCRHTVATKASELGINPAIAANRLGNSIEVYLKKYVHQPQDIIYDSLKTWIEQ